MVRKSLLTVFSLLMALLIGAAGVGAAGKTDTTPLPAANGQTSGSQTSPDAAAGSAFTYQGRLTSGGNAANGNYDLNFSLWDAASGGTQVGSTFSVANQAVTNGLFTVQLDFGVDAFQGSARWLQMAVRQTGGGSFTTLAPRQPLTAAPYATSLMPGAVITGTTLVAPILSVSNTSSGDGVRGTSNTGVGVYGSSFQFSGVYGWSNHGNGGTFWSNDNTALYAYSPSSIGVFGSSASPNDAGIYGSNGNGGPGVVGISPNGIGGYFTSTASSGVYGETSGPGSPAGVYGKSTGANGNGLIGEANSGVSAFGIWAKSTSGYAGYFSGNVAVAGTLSKSAGSFKIDDPTDPANKYLSHSFVESPDMMNIYNGNITTDAKGEASITMPAWFEPLNRDFRYQLTIMGDQFAQARVSSEMKENHFSIKTDKPNIKVSWQVTGIRHDAYADAHRIPVEESKPINERGYYIHPANKAVENARSGAPNAPATIPGGK